jgi:pimeloyl-ACP methyl ester carboxylesterase
MEVREECMLATCEKQPLSATSNMVYCKRLTIVLALLCVLPIGTLAQKVDTAQNPPAPIGNLVDVGAYRVHLYCTGTGSPTVVIMGAGLSFTWGLVQPEVAKFAQVCSYDHSGVGWSDSGPKDSCALRVNEAHKALKNAGIKGPYVIVGHSLGGMVARLYAERYPDEVVGMVLVDHSFSLRLLARSLSGAKGSPSPPPAQESAPLTAGGLGPNATLIESDPNFNKLSPRDRELDRWAMSQPRIQNALKTNHELSPECFSEAEAITKEHPHPLNDKPLVDVSRGEDRSPEYDKFQVDLLSLSRNSKEIVAENSSHFVIIDRPDVVIDAIRQVVQAVRNKAKL